jgi:hypothetical protein
MRWHCDGVLDRLHFALYQEARELAGKEASPTGAIVDSRAWKAPKKEAEHWSRKEQTMKTITRGPRGLGQLIFLAVLFALVADATAQQPAELIIRNGLTVAAQKAICAFATARLLKLGRT